MMTEGDILSTWDVGDFLTGIDRSYPRSIYQFLGFEAHWTKVLFISYKGDFAEEFPEVNKTYYWDYTMANRYRLATPIEVEESSWLPPNPTKESKAADAISKALCFGWKGPHYIRIRRGEPTRVTNPY